MQRFSEKCKVEKDFVEVSRRNMTKLRLKILNLDTVGSVCGSFFLTDGVTFYLNGFTSICDGVSFYDGVWVLIPLEELPVFSP